MCSRYSRACAHLPTHTWLSCASCSNAGVRAIWCEKPLASSLEEGRELVAACSERAAALQVNFLRRFDSFHREVAADLGGVRVHADVRFSGTLSNYGSHAFDLFRWLAGDVEWVHAIPTEGGGPLVLAGAGKGSTATFLQVRNPVADVLDVMIYADESRITISCLGEELGRATARPSALFPGYISLPLGALERDGGLADAMLNGVNSLVEHLDAGSPLACDGDDGLAALEIAAAVARSLETGGRVRPDLA